MPATATTAQAPPAQADDHTCPRGPLCGQMEHYLNCPHTNSDDPRCHCAPCDHLSCTAIVFAWECKGCERDCEAMAEQAYTDYDGRRAWA